MQLNIEFNNVKSFVILKREFNQTGRNKLNGIKILKLLEIF